MAGSQGGGREASKRALAYGSAHTADAVAALGDMIRFPSVSADPRRRVDVRACAEWLAEHLSAAGLHHARLVPTAGHPVVYADWLGAAGRPTLLIYGHYDVQPEDPLDEWRSPPFEPTIRGDNIHGRGASDDKGQLLAHVAALTAYLRATGAVPLNVRCLFEGEEEIGSPSLPALLEREAQTFAADVAVISDMPILGPDRPAITESLRGALSVELEVRGARRDLHSGIYGGAVHNPLQALSEILAQLHDPRGRIAIPGFYDRVRSWSDAERAYMAAVGPTDADILRAAAASGGWGEAGYSIYERTTIRPALSVNGLVGGYQGPGVKAVIPARACAKINLRLAPDQDPREVESLLRAQIARLTPSTVHSAVRTQLAARPATVDRRHPAIRAAALAYRNGFGTSPAFVRLGGTIPVVDFLRRRLHLETALMGFALPDDRMHAPNEKFHLPTFFRGIVTSICFLAVLARVARPVAA